MTHWSKMPNGIELNLAWNKGKYSTTTLPFKRNALEIDCPCSGESKLSTNWWICVKCQEIIDQGFDGNFYCKCGRAPGSQFQFKCSKPSHGDNFMTFAPGRLRTILANLNPKKELNILIMGPTGAGKSTWVNGFVNYLSFPTFEAARGQAEPMIVIGGSFNITDVNYKPTEIVIRPDEQECSKPGQSSTQRAMVYAFETRSKIVRLIDTPGVGDTRGPEQDYKNVDNVLSILSRFNQINGVCILLKPNETRMDVIFRFCIQELLKQIHKDAVGNIVFCFTNTRGTFYKPGESLVTLSGLLQDHHVGIALDKSNTFCFDNEAFRLLCAQRQGIHFSDDDIKQYECSWLKSVEETNRLLDHCLQIKPLELKKCLSLNKIRQTFIFLAKPIGDLIQSIQTNIVLAEKKRRELNSFRASNQSLEKVLSIPSNELDAVLLEFPRTVCASQKCVRYLKMENSEELVIEYAQHCHKKCYLKDVDSDKYPSNELRICKVMDRGGICTKCGCPWDKHMHVVYETTPRTTRTVSAEIKRLIDSKVPTAQSIEAVRQILTTRIQTLEEREEMIEENCAKIAKFLKTNALVAYNDAVSIYLDSLISTQRETFNQTKNNKEILDSMEAVRSRYEVVKHAMEQAVDSGQEGSRGGSNLEKADELLKGLFQLPSIGDDFKRVLDVAAKARKQLIAYNEVRYKIKWTIAIKLSKSVTEIHGSDRSDDDDYG